MISNDLCTINMKSIYSEDTHMYFSQLGMLIVIALGVALGVAIGVFLLCIVLCYMKRYSIDLDMKYVHILQKTMLKIIQYYLDKFRLILAK